MSLHVYNSLWLIETHNRYRYITYFKNRRNLVIDMTVYMNVWILILLSFLNFLASVADRTDNIASFEEHGTQTHTHTHRYTLYELLSLFHRVSRIRARNRDSEGDNKSETGSYFDLVLPILFRRVITKPPLRSLWLLDLYR